MDYQEAHNYIFNEIGEEGIKLLMLVADDKTIEGINLIRELTNCNDSSAKMIWVDLKCEYGTSENNPIIEARESLSPQQIAHNNAIAQEWLNKPHCPICNSTNLSKISTVKKATKIGLFGIFGAGDVGKIYKCNNCGSRF